MAETKSNDLVEITLARNNREDDIQRGRSYLADFNAIPWCSAILNAPNITVMYQLQRGGPGGDFFWTQTLRSPDTIRGAIHVISSNLAPEYPRIKSSVALYSLGPGLIGHPGCCHGGVVSTLFDEAMGCFVGLIEQCEAEENKAYMRREVYTLKSEVVYKKPVPAPGVVLVRSSITHVEGKKRIVTATIEDENGNVLGEAKADYLAVERGRLEGWYAKL